MYILIFDSQTGFLHTFYISVDNPFAFQTTQSFKNMSEHNSVVTEYKFLLILIHDHVIQYTGQIFFLCKLFIKVFYRCKYVTITMWVTKFDYILWFLKGITDRKHLFPSLSYSPVQQEQAHTLKHRHITHFRDRNACNIPRPSLTYIHTV